MIIRSCALSMAVFVSMFYIFGIIMTQTAHTHGFFHYFLGMLGRIACIMVALYVATEHAKVCHK